MSKSSGQNVSLFEKERWDIKDVAEFTKLKVSYLYNLSAKGEIPRVKTRRKRIEFIPQEIKKWFYQGG